MSSDDSYLDKKYEKLSAAIMQSITSSDEIREILQDMGSKDLIHKSAVFNLLLSLEELDSYMNPKPFNEEIYKLEPPKARRQFIRGVARELRCLALHNDQ